MKRTWIVVSLLVTAVVLLAACSGARPVGFSSDNARPNPSGIRNAAPSDAEATASAGSDGSIWRETLPVREVIPPAPVVLRAVVVTSAVDPSDDWPRLSADRTVASALPDGLVPYFDNGERTKGDFSDMAYAVYGATETTSGIDVYCSAVFGRWQIRDAVMRSADYGSNEMVVRLARHGASRWRIASVWEQGDYESDPGPDAFPSWARARADARPESAVASECLTPALAWAIRRMPADRLVQQPRRVLTVPDQHHHVPALNRLRMLNPKYRPLSIVALGLMRASIARDPLFGPWSSDDGRFHLYDGTEYEGFVLEDKRTGLAYDLATPGQIPPGTDEGQDLPMFFGHTLVMDIQSGLASSDFPTVIHFVIDCDTHRVMSAVPVGPLGLNAPR